MVLTLCVRVPTDTGLFRLTISGLVRAVSLSLQLLDGRSHDYSPES